MNTSSELVATLHEAATGALRALGDAEVSVREVRDTSALEGFADVSAVLKVTTQAGDGYFVLSATETTATALAKLVLAGVVSEPNTGMVRDCLGEIVNVVAGQAKTLLFGTPLHFVLGTPTVVTGTPTLASPERVLVTFASEFGEFALHVRLLA